MNGESDLKKLLTKTNPELNDNEFVFLNFKKIPSVLSDEYLMIFKEKEGYTLIVKKEMAIKNKINFDHVWALITLNIHSDLQAVGFLAAITKKLAKAGISVNAVSAYYHDHLFVPWEKRDHAMNLLKSL